MEVWVLKLGIRYLSRMRGDVRIVKLLISAKARLEVQDADGSTALTIAVSQQNFKI